MPVPIKELSLPFPASLMKRRKGNFGKTIEYIEASEVVSRLNSVLEGQWSFAVIDFRIEAEEVIVHGELRIGGEVRQQFGGSIITRTKDGGQLVSLADDLKAAASDCLKKCASTFGVGLYLYQDTAPAKVNRPKPEPPTDGNGNGHISQEALARLLDQAKQAGFQQSDLIVTAKLMFNTTLGQMTVVQAQQLVQELNKSREVAHA